MAHLINRVVVLVNEDNKRQFLELPDTEEVLHVHRVNGSGETEFYFTVSDIANLITEALQIVDTVGDCSWNAVRGTIVEYLTGEEYNKKDIYSTEELMSWGRHAQSFLESVHKNLDENHHLML